MSDTAKSEIVKQESRVSLRSFAAGSIAGGFGTVVGYPMDTLKVLSQTGRGTTGLGLRDLFSGMSVPILTTGFIQAVNLGLFENIRRSIQSFQGLSPTVPASLGVITLSGATAGVCVSVLTCPLQRVKVLQQFAAKGHPGGPQKHESWLSTARRAGGIRGLYVGLPMQVACEAGRGFYLATYFGCLRYMTPYFVAAGGDQGRGDNASPPVSCRVVAGGVAGVVNWSIIYPFDVVKSVMQSRIPEPPSIASLDVPKTASKLETATNGGEAGALSRCPRNNASPTAWDCAKALYREGGVRRLYKGLGVTLIRAAPVAGVVLPTYDIALEGIGRLAPGLE